VREFVSSALNRRESRGAHSREDYPERDDTQFLQHTLAYYSRAGIDLEYMPVVVNRFGPKERKYWAQFKTFYFVSEIPRETSKKTKLTANCNEFIGVSVLRKSEGKIQKSESLTLKVFQPV
jgi:hypothetical protein